MRKIFVSIFTLAALAALVSCGSAKVEKPTRGTQYPGMYDESPKVLLVMPPINRTSNVDAKEGLYTSISKPLAEAGYYVISPFLAMDILKAESAYDAEVFAEAPLTKFGDFFGCDAVVFSEIETWTKRGFGIETDIRYFIRSAKTGNILFDRSCELYLDLNSDSGSNSALGSLISLAVSTATTAATKPIVAARAANYYIFNDIPRGPYHPDFQKDQDVIAEQKDIKTTIKP